MPVVTAAEPMGEHTQGEVLHGVHADDGSAAPPPRAACRMLVLQRKGKAMKEQASDPHPLSDLAYDWITLMQNKAQALLAYDQYIKDAEAANSPECAAFFRKVHDADKAQLEEAKQHLVAVLQGKMGSPKK
jgi:hypothetical protein